MHSNTNIKAIFDRARALAFDPEAFDSNLPEWIQSGVMTEEKITRLAKLLATAVISGDAYVDSFCREGENRNEQYRALDATTDERYKTWNELQRLFSNRSGKYQQAKTDRKFLAIITKQFRSYQQKNPPPKGISTHCPGRDFDLLRKCCESLRAGVPDSSAWQSKRRIDEVLENHTNRHASARQIISDVDVYRYFESKIVHMQSWDSESKKQQVGYYYCIRYAYKNAGYLNISSFNVAYDSESRSLSYKGSRSDRENQNPYEHTGNIIKVAPNALKMIGMSGQKDYMRSEDINLDGHLFETILLSEENSFYDDIELRSGIYSGLNDKKTAFSANMIFIKSKQANLADDKSLAFTCTLEEFFADVNDSRFNPSILNGIADFEKLALQGGDKGVSKYSLLKLIKNSTKNKYQSLLAKRLRK